MPVSEDRWLDRVNQAYYGELGEHFALITRSRINWIGSQVRGKHILDVGCSQGILAILLAREGIEVTAIDISQAALDYAQAELNKEAPMVAERVKLLKMDLASFEEESVFDTVVLGEVIEHQMQPERLIAAALKHLKPEGRLILTTPFGLNPWPDHKCTLYPDALESMVDGLLDVEVLDVREGYIWFVGIHRKGAKPKCLAAAATKHAAAYFKSESTSLTIKLKELEKRSSWLEEHKNKLTRKVKELTDLLTASAEKQVHLDEEYAAAEKKVKEAEALRVSEGDEFQKQITEAEKRIQLVKKDLVTSKEQLEKLDTKLQETTAGKLQIAAQLDAQQKNYAELSIKLEQASKTAEQQAKEKQETAVQVEELRHEVARFHEEIHSGKEARKHLLEEKREAEQRAAAQTDQLELEISNLSKELDIQRKNYAELSIKLEQASKAAEQQAKEKQETAVQVEELRHEAVRFHEEIHSGKEARKHLLEEKREAEQRAAAQTDQLELKIINLSRELERAKGTVGHLADTIERVEDLKATEHRQYEAEVDDYKKRVANLEEELVRQSAVMDMKTVALENRVQVVREMISFQLGAELLEAMKSPAKALALPSTLWRIHMDAERRKARKTLREEVVSKGPAYRKMVKTLQSEGFEAVKIQLSSNGLSPAANAAVLTAMAKELVSVAFGNALDAAREAERLDPKPYRAKWLAFQLFEHGYIAEPAELLAGAAKECDLSASEQKRAHEIAVLSKLKSNLPSIPQRRTSSYTPVQNSVLYVAASSLPYHITGYTTRTHELLLSLRKSGAVVTVLTRPGYPWDRNDRRGDPYSRSTVIEGIEYIHRRSTSMNLPLDLHLSESAQTITRVARDLKVAVIQAPSNYVNALPALIAARNLGIPFIYEMRGLWDLSRASKIKGYDQTERFQLGMDLEVLVAKNADRVCVISNPLGRFIQEWGIKEELIGLLPNCINAETIERAKKTAGPKEKFFTVGYAGSLLPYEGLDFLVKAIGGLKAKGIKVFVKIIGDGPSRQALEALAKKNSVASQIEFLGKVSPDKARALLAMTHAVVIPRQPERICELIPPIKLVEAMGLGLPVVVADLPALCEEVKDGTLGKLFKAGDVASLEEALYFLMKDSEAGRKLGRDSEIYVQSARTWAKFTAATSPVSPLNLAALPKSVDEIPATNVKENGHKDAGNDAKKLRPSFQDRRPQAASPDRGSAPVSIAASTAVVEGSPTATLKKKIGDFILHRGKQVTLKYAFELGSTLIVQFITKDKAKEAKKGLVVEVLYFDNKNSRISGRYPKCGKSARFSAYFYVPVGSPQNAVLHLHALPTPEGAVLVELRVIGWETERGVTFDSEIKCEELSGSLIYELLSKHSASLPMWLVEEAIQFARAQGDLTLQRKMLLFHLSRGHNERISGQLRGIESELQELEPEWYPHLNISIKRKPATDAITICHLQKTGYPFENSGGAIRCLNILKSQKEIGLDPYVITPPGYPGNATCPGASSHEVVEGVDNFRIGPDTDGVNALLPRERVIYGTVQSARIFSRRGGSVIHAASGVRGYELALQAFAMRDIFRVPVIYEVRSFHEHTWSILREDILKCERTQMRIKKENHCMQMADHVVTISETMRKVLIERGVPPEKIDVIPNAIDNALYLNPPTAAEIPELEGAEVVVGYVSNMSLREGHVHLLRAIAQLRSCGRDIRCLLVGDGPEKQDLERLAEELGIRAVTVFTGEIDHHQIGSYYRAINIFVVPRIPDYAADWVTPLKPYEAMGYKIPLIVSDLPALREIVGLSERGLLAKPGDPNDLAKAIENVIMDAAATGKRINRAHDWVVNHCTWSANATKYRSIYEKILRKVAA